MRENDGIVVQLREEAGWRAKLERFTRDIYFILNFNCYERVEQAALVLHKLEPASVA
jgi:hypothetical protein